MSSLVHVCVNNIMHFTLTRPITCICRHAYRTCFKKFSRCKLNYITGQLVQSRCSCSSLVNKWTPSNLHTCRYVMNLHTHQYLFHSTTCIQSQSSQFISSNSSSQQIAEECEGIVDKQDKPLTVEGSHTFYKFYCNVHEQMPDMSLSEEDWDTLIEQILSENIRLSKRLPGMIMKMIANVRKFYLAESFLNFLRSSGRTPNIVTLTTYISLCGQVYGKEKQDELFRIYEEVKEISKVFDTNSCRHLIEGLSRTDHWAETLPLLEMVKISNVPSTLHYSPIARAAFREGDYQTGMQLLERMGQEHIRPHCDVFTEFITNVPTVQNSDFTVELLLRTMKAYEWIPDRNVAEQIADHFSSSGSAEWRHSWTSVSERGDCCSCGHTHPVLELTGEEFSQLQSAFLQKALISDNIYLKSMPEEVNKYLTFIRSRPRFDVVVDGLNVAKYQKAGGLGAAVQERQLKRIVMHLLREERLNVLVLGRKHMQRWNIHRLTPCFLLDNTSADDPFLLHATLYSGRRARFLSNDYMNDHHHLLGTHHGQIFRKWQRSRQIQIHHISREHLQFKKPQCYDTLVVEDHHGWHIPYTNADIDAAADGDERDEVHVTEDEIKRWLCLRKT